MASRPSPQESGEPSRRRGRRSGTRRRRQRRHAPPMDDGAVKLDPAIGPLSAFDCIMRELSLPQEVDLYELLWQEPVDRPRRSGILSEASSSAAPPSDHPRAEGAVTGTRVRQSVLYSDNPRRPRRRQGPGLTEEHPSEVSSSDLGRAVTDLPTLKALSLSDPPLLTPQTAEESDDDYDDAPPVPIGFGIGSLGPQTLQYSVRPPRPTWLGGVRGQTMPEKRACDASSGELSRTVTVPSRSEAQSVNNTSSTPQSTKEKPTKNHDHDTEEELRLLREYYAANPCTSISQMLDEFKAAEHAALTALAAKCGTEPPPPLRKHLPVDQETQSRQQASAAAPRVPRQEASTEEIIKNAEEWMSEEVMLVFKNYIERRADHTILDYRLDELCHQCFNVEDYNNVFHHYNFTVRMKKANSADWMVALYFAEVKQIFGRKYYFCCRLEPNENGHCYACKNQGVEDLQHPAMGGFDAGRPDVGFSLWYTNE